MLKEFPSNKTNGTRNAPFFHEFQLLTVLLLIRDSYMSRTTMFISVKVWKGFSIFDSVSFLLKFLLWFSKKAWTL